MRGRVNGVVREALELTMELGMFISFSSKHSSLLECLKSQLSLDTPTIKLLCPTRWTVRTAAIGAILANYDFLCKLLVEVNERVKPVNY